MSLPQNGPDAQPLTTISLDALAMPDETSVETNASSLQIMSISNDAAYLGFFTKDGFPIEVHWTKEAPGWAPGFVHCLGDECPACKAGLKINRYILLPVLDRITAKVFMLRISTARGPGKLITELGKVLTTAELLQAVIHTRQKLATAERRTCRVIGLARRSLQYRPAPRGDDALRLATIRLAKQYSRYGYRKITELLHFEGWRVKHRKVERLWREEGLQLPQRHKKRRRLYHKNCSIIRLPR